MFKYNILDLRTLNYKKIIKFKNLIIYFFKTCLMHLLCVRSTSCRTESGNSCKELIIRFRYLYLFSIGTAQSGIPIIGSFGKYLNYYQGFLVARVPHRFQMYYTINVNITLMHIIFYIFIVFYIRL